MKRKRPTYELRKFIEQKINELSRNLILYPIDSNDYLIAQKQMEVLLQIDEICKKRNKY